MSVGVTADMDANKAELTTSDRDGALLAVYELSSNSIAHRRIYLMNK